MKRAALILSGSGYLDGAEIREAVLALLALDEAGAHVTIFAPDVAQHHVVNHLTGEVDPSPRNVLVEAARIARGKARPLRDLDPAQFDLLVCPGGYGVAKTLSSLAFGKPEVLPDFARVLQAFAAAAKPICAICIAPAVLVTALKYGRVTIGNDAGTAAHIVAMGGAHETQAVTGVTVDADHKLVTTPAYMYDDAAIADVAKGIRLAVYAALELA